eukprot:6190540-Pleurochrysis_carterae.AAC.1
MLLMSASNYQSTARAHLHRRSHPHAAAPCPAARGSLAITRTATSLASTTYRAFSSRSSRSSTPLAKLHGSAAVLDSLRLVSLTRARAFPLLSSILPASVDTHDFVVRRDLSAHRPWPAHCRG